MSGCYVRQKVVKSSTGGCLPTADINKGEWTILQHLENHVHRHQVKITKVMLGRL